MKASEVLSRAAHLLGIRGHAKYDLEDRDGHVCLMGAINLAYRNHSDYPQGLGRKTPPDYLNVVAQLHAFVQHRPTHAAVTHDPVTRQIWDLTDWNNADVRTGDEVIEALESAAAIAELAGD